MDLTAEKRKSMPGSEFALSGKRFPMNDKEHARLAISGATRSERAGNISPSTADKIKAEARHKLGDAPARSHALSIASANHLHSMGHITSEHRARIESASRKGLAAAGKGHPPAFGSLAPAGGSDRY